MNHAAVTLGRAYILVRIVRGDYVENIIDSIQKIRRGPHTEFLAALTALNKIRRCAADLLKDHQAHLDAGAGTCPPYGDMFRNLDPFLRTILIGIAREIPTGFTNVSEAAFRHKMVPVRLSPILAGGILRNLLTGGRQTRAPVIAPVSRKRPAEPEPEPRKRPTESRTIIRGVEFRATQFLVVPRLDRIEYSVSRHYIVGTPLEHCFAMHEGVAMPVFGRKVEIKFDDIITRLEPAQKFGRPKNGLYYIVAAEHLSQVYGIAVLMAPTRGLRTANFTNY